MNSRQLGTVGLARALTWFVQNGYNVSLPISDNQRYDLIVEKGGICQRVEVKFASGTEVNLRTWGGNWTQKSVLVGRVCSEDADLLYCVTSRGEYLIPVAEIEGRSTVSPRDRWQVLASVIDVNGSMTPFQGGRVGSSPT